MLLVYFMEFNLVCNNETFFTSEKLKGREVMHLFHHVPHNDIFKIKDPPCFMRTSARPAFCTILEHCPISTSSWLYNRVWSPLGRSSHYQGLSFFLYKWMKWWWWGSALIIWRVPFFVEVVAPVSLALSPTSLWTLLPKPFKIDKQENLGHFPHQTQKTVSCGWSCFWLLRIMCRPSLPMRPSAILEGHSNTPSSVLTVGWL